MAPESALVQTGVGLRPQKKGVPEVQNTLLWKCAADPMSPGGAEMPVLVIGCVCERRRQVLRAAPPRPLLPFLRKDGL